LGKKLIKQRNKSSEIRIRHDFQFDYDDHARWVLTGWQMGRLEFVFKNQNFDPKTNLLLKKTEAEIIESIKPILSSKGIKLHDDEPDYQSMSRALNRDIELLSGRYYAFYLVGMAANRMSLAESAGGRHRSEMLGLARSCVDSIPSQYLKDKELFFDELLRNKFGKVVFLTDYLTSLCESSKPSLEKPAQQDKQKRLVLEISEGANIGDIVFGGDKVGRDKVGTHVGGDQVGRDKIEGISLTLPQAFTKLRESLSKEPDTPEKSIAETALKQLEVEGKKGEQADEKEVKKWFTTLVDYLPDIGEVAVNTFLNPISGLSTVFQKIARIIKKRTSIS